MWRLARVKEGSLDAVLLDGQILVTAVVIAPSAAFKAAIVMQSVMMLPPRYEVLIAAHGPSWASERVDLAMPIPTQGIFPSMGGAEDAIVKTATSEERVRIRNAITLSVLGI